MEKIILSFCLSVVALMAEYIQDQETVTDTQNGFMWQDSQETMSVRRDWEGAVAYCEKLELAGHNDWRLPNIRELKTIIDHSKYMPAMNPAFRHVALDGYWSATPYAKHPTHVWNVHFGTGGGYYYLRDGQYFVRCVRKVEKQKQ